MIPCEVRKCASCEELLVQQLWAAFYLSNLRAQLRGEAGADGEAALKVDPIKITEDNACRPAGQRYMEREKESSNEREEQMRLRQEIEKERHSRVSWYSACFRAAFLSHSAANAAALQIEALVDMSIGREDICSRRTCKIERNRQGERERARSVCE